MAEPLDTNAHPEPEHPLHGCSHTGVLPLAAESATGLLTESWSQNLRAKGRRVTKQRLAVLRAVQAHPHANTEEIVTVVRQEIPTITVQSVYMILTDLTNIDMLRKFEPREPRGSTRHARAITITTHSAFAAEKFRM